VTSPERKPVRAEGEPAARCYCNHSAEAHPCSKSCTCKLFQPRPCVCEHPFHAGECKECRCRHYREDRSPEHILREGLRIGQWGIQEIPRLQSLMRPEHPRAIRVLACLMIHAMDRREKKRNRARLVTMMVCDCGHPEYAHDGACRKCLCQKFKGKTSVPMAPNDVKEELNYLDTIPRLDRHKVRSELREWERAGNVRVVGKVRKNTRILLYARPLKSRDLEPLPEPDPREPKSEPPEPGEPRSKTPKLTPDLGAKSDPQILPTASQDDHLGDSVVLPIRSLLVKTFRHALREEMEKSGMKWPDLGAESDPQKLIGEEVEKLILGVQSSYQKVREGVCLAPQTPAPINKERARVPVTPVKGRGEESQQVGRQVDVPANGSTPTSLPTPVRPFSVAPDFRADPAFVAMVGVVEEVAVPVIGESPTDAQYIEIHTRLKGASPQHYRQRLEIKKARGKLNSIMILGPLADDCAESKDKWKPAAHAQAVGGRKSFVESVNEAAAHRLAKWGHL
jgi:hypothetical protein